MYRAQSLHTMRFRTQRDVATISLPPREREVIEFDEQCRVPGIRLQAGPRFGSSDTSSSPSRRTFARRPSSLMQTTPADLRRTRSPAG